MSEENVELALRLTEAFNRRDVDAAVALWDDEGVWYPALEALTEGRSAYRGRAGLLQYYRDLSEIAEDGRADYSQVHDLGDQVLCLGRLSVRFASGVQLEQESGCLFTWRDGKYVEARAYMDHAEAREAARMRE